MPRKQHKYHFIYKTTCVITNKFYFGMHSTSNLNDGYRGSGKRLLRSFNKYGKINHNFEIIEWYSTRSELVNRERELVNEDLLKDPMCMNLMIGGEGIGRNHAQESKDKISATLTGKTYEEIHGVNNANEERLKRSNTVKNYWLALSDSDRNERKKKISDSLKDNQSHKDTIKRINRKKIVCPFCNKVGKYGGMKVWHFDNCKLNPINIDKPKKIRKSYSRKRIMCPHCKKIGADNGMKRFHFDNCKMKDPL